MYNCISIWNSKYTIANTYIVQNVFRVFFMCFFFWNKTENKHKRYTHFTAAHLFWQLSTSIKTQCENVVICSVSGYNQVYLISVSHTFLHIVTNRLQKNSKKFCQVFSSQILFQSVRKPIFWPFEADLIFFLWPIPILQRKCGKVRVKEKVNKFSEARGMRVKSPSKPQPASINLYCVYFTVVCYVLCFVQFSIGISIIMISTRELVLSTPTSACNPYFTFIRRLPVIETPFHNILKVLKAAFWRGRWRRWPHI